MSAAEPITPFANHLQVDIRFGDGVAAALPATVRRLGSDAAIVVVDEA